MVSPAADMAQPVGYYFLVARSVPEPCADAVPFAQLVACMPFTAFCSSRLPSECFVVCAAGLTARRHRVEIGRT